MILTIFASIQWTETSIPHVQLTYFTHFLMIYLLSYIRELTSCWCQKFYDDVSATDWVMLQITWNNEVFKLSFPEEPARQRCVGDVLAAPPPTGQVCIYSKGTWKRMRKREKVSEREREPKKNKKKCVLVYLLWHICLVFMTCISVLSFMAYECFYFLINCFQLSHVGDRNLTSLLTSYLISRDKLGMKIQSFLTVVLAF
jgi:hypothetical protein